MVKIKELKKSTIMRFAIVAMGVISLVTYAQIGFWRGGEVYADFQDDYAEILACLNGQEWSVGEEWSEDDLDVVLACLYAVEQVTNTGGDIVYEPDEIEESDVPVVEGEHLLFANKSI